MQVYPRVVVLLPDFVGLCICGLLILILAEPRAVRTSDVVSVVYNVDVSDSVNEARNQALEMVAGTAAEKPATDQAGLVVFGRTAAVEYPPRETFPFEKYINSTSQPGCDKSGTIAGAQCGDVAGRTSRTHRAGERWDGNCRTVERHY